VKPVASKLLCLPFLAAIAVADDAPRRPNVILVMTDDQGYGDVGFHGNEQIRTPHLDRFAREGIELTRFYVEPVCAPTRASLLTGRSYYRTGVIHTSRGGAKMYGDETTIAELLKGAGYRTGVFGKWHLGDNFPMRPGDQGFEESLVHASGGIDQAPDKPNSYVDPRLRHNGEPVESQGYCTDVFFAAATRFIEEHRDDPFLVYLPLNAPHTPLQVPESYVAPYRAAGLDDTTARVYGMVTNIDENLGRLLARLGELGLRENTLVVFLTDNGPQQQRFNAGLRGRKSWTYEGGVRVPFVAQWPGRWAGGRKVDTIAAHVDVLPTLLDVCGVARPERLELDGRSLVPLLSRVGSAHHRTDERPSRPANDDANVERGDAVGGAHPTAIFLQCHRGLEPTAGRNAAVVTQRWKLVLGPGEFSDPRAAGREPVVELYDIEADPGEAHDLAREEPERVAELRERYEAWFADVRRSRNFRPGIITVGSEAENPTQLCRYQDAHWDGDEPQGWDVRIARGGRYEVSVVRADREAGGTISVRWQGRTQTAEVGRGGSTVGVELPAGVGRLDVWYRAENAERIVHTDNDTLGDTVLRYVGE
jgi:arylsulfatase A-like enzyme